MICAFDFKTLMAEASTGESTKRASHEATVGCRGLFVGENNARTKFFQFPVMLHASPRPTSGALV